MMKYIEMKKHMEPSCEIYRISLHQKMYTCMCIFLLVDFIHYNHIFQHEKKIQETLAIIFFRFLLWFKYFDFLDKSNFLATSDKKYYILLLSLTYRRS